MKLQAQYNRITIISAFLILLLAAATYYFPLRYVLTNQLDETLKVEEAEIIDHISKYDALPEPTVYKDQRISFQKTDKPVKRSFRSLELFIADQNEKELSRQLVFPVIIRGQHFTASVTKSEEATEELVWIILLSTFALIVLLTVILFFTSKYLFRKLWRPFQATLDSIKSFDLSAPVDITMQPTHINEFRELNESIRLMSQKVLKDYQSLKDFTDHASHEMQTPLAVINSKLDLLIQEPELSEKSMEQVQGIYNAADKLARLCQSLLLLTRIENNQYRDTQPVQVNLLVEEKIAEMDEWINSMEIKVMIQPGALRVNMNRELAEILVSNLLRNAIRHSVPGSGITIITNENKLSISNTGKMPLDQKKIFNRFYKSEQSEGSGLGLAIVQRICEQYQFSFSYNYINGEHSFQIIF